ncbi:AAA family ATPase [Chryseobacterium sp. CFBP8996]|uniref:ATP-binding protein n=1 Tax=Chryseobacterium sp. CFBP8996 TaxID=3096529 RepID=UPI002A6B781B|nr:AAA family ATPase [Chryseobacterium sp. CFBP8996]MDY0931622.1 AAA family ATPase [Chryseobacterium sp. CFBP8996]
MNKFKILSLYIKNFKCITESEFNFESNNLIVYDGPNGYGKTTCFEAIEILFTETPRKARTSFVDRRYSFKDSPIHKSNDKEIVISIVLKDNEGKQLKFKRIFPPANNFSSTDNNIGKVFSLSKLYINDNTQESSLKEIEELLEFENIYSLFNLLNYVEQDENTYFLKRDPKNRYNAIESLLGGEEERLILIKLNGLKDQIKKRKKIYDDEVELLQKDNLITISENTVDIPFDRLIKNKDFDWDRKDIKNTDNDIHQQYLTEIDKVNYLVVNKDSIENVIISQKINSLLNTNFIDVFINYYWGINNFDILKGEQDRKLAIDHIVQRNNNIIEFVEKLNYKKLGDQLEIDFIFQKNIQAESISSYKTFITTILSMQENLSIDNRVLSELKEKREQILKINEQHRNIIHIKDSECPICGYDWGTYAELIKNIEETESKILKSYLENNIEYEKLKKQFSETILNTLTTFLNTENQVLKEEKENLVSAYLYSQILYYQNRQSEFKDIILLFNEDVQNEILNEINHRIIGDLTVTKEKFIQLINDNRPLIDSTLDQSIIKNDFDYYFENNLEELKLISTESVDSKRKYIQWEFYNSISHNISSKQQTIVKLEATFNKIDRLSQKIDNQIKRYTNTIVEKIKIPFHIYTGKILQNHSLGSGLNIDFDMERQKQLYITPSYKDQEVAFTLSSGQLSATVISLMFVLNKVFNQSKLGTIFIDDPLQTLDEINAHSLVELLKYNFPDQQIILSTHEDKYSRFIRYKFDKFGLSGKNFNMRDLD